MKLADVPLHQKLLVRGFDLGLAGFFDGYTGEKFILNIDGAGYVFLPVEAVKSVEKIDHAFGTHYADYLVVLEDGWGIGELNE